MEALDYSFAGIDGEVVDSSSHRGRVSVLLFVTTFDVASQAQAKRLEDLARTHVPRINATAIVLEAPQYVDLARAFRDNLDLHYELAIAQQSSLQDQGLLRHVRSVPTWIFLNREGRLGSVVTGALTPEAAEERVAELE